MTERILSTETEIRYSPPCMTAEEMEDLCCRPVGELPCCTKVEEWDGYTDEELLERIGLVLDDQGRDAGGDYVVVERLPRDKPCGRLITEYDLDQDDCCEFVEDLVWDEDRSTEVMADYSSGTIFVSEGKRPLRVSIRGTGFYLRGGRRDAFVEGDVIHLETTEACGTGELTINDGCTVIRPAVRSVNGQWLVVEQCGKDFDFRGDGNCLVTDTLVWHSFFKTRGKYHYGVGFCADLADNCPTSGTGCPDYGIELVGCVGDWCGVQGADEPCYLWYSLQFRNLNPRMVGSKKWEWVC